MSEEYLIPEESVILEKLGDFKINYSASRRGSILAHKTNVYGRFKLISWTRNIVKDIFLPLGYPLSVSSDYLTYQIWDMLQAFFHTINEAFATFSILKSVGVGNEEATALSATITWITKDVSGMVGRMAFVWWRGFSLDSECKKWKLTTDIINNIALFMELLLRFESVRNHVVLILCISNAIKGIVKIAGGAIRSSIIQHQAIRGNMADVSAKDGCQETYVNLLGSILALLILIWIEYCSWCIWTLFFIFTFLHLYSNYKSLKCLKLRTLNSSRMILLVTDFLKFNRINSVKRVNDDDSVLFQFGISDQKICKRRIYMGRSLQHIIASFKLHLDHFNHLQTLYHSFQYMIVFDNCSINVILREKITEREILMGYFHALIYGIVLSNLDELTFEKLNTNYSEEMDELVNLCKKTNQIEVHVNKFVIKKWAEFSTEAKKKGWILENHQLAVEEWRAKWS